MLKTYLKTAWRHLKKNKGYALLNMFGLALGISCAVLILLWINDEWQYNRFQKNYERLYQVFEHQSYDNKTFTFAAMPGPFVPGLKAEFPEVEYAARADWGGRYLFTLGDKSIYERGMHVDPEFLKVFSFKVLKGDAATMLNDPTSIVITDVMAKKFFGNEDPIGKTLQANNDNPLKVTGVIEEPPLNSNIRFSWLVNYKKWEAGNAWAQQWGNNGIQNFVVLKEGVEPARVNKKIYNYIQSKDTSAVAHAFLLPASDWRLRNNFEEGKQTGGRIEYVRLFSIIASLIIIIACINFMNLATARSEKRAREVGVRKVMGARRSILIRQFFGESIVMALSAMLIALLIVFLTLPAFNKLVEKELTLTLNNPVLWAGLPLIGLLCGVLAGSYPSLYLSSFSPSAVFRGLQSIKGSAITYIRKGLVVAQFAVSIILIISTIVIYKQIQHTKDRNLGFNKNNVIYTPLRKMGDHLQAVQQDLLATGVVESAAISNNQILDIGSSSGGFSWPGKPADKDVLITMEHIGAGYLQTLGLRLQAGRDFYANTKADSSSIIINETLAHIIGKENLVGTTIRQGNDSYQVVGVVKDFIYNNMYGRPEPLIFLCNPGYANNIAIRLKPTASIPQAATKIEKVIKRYSPAYPFEYDFLDDEFNNRFKSEMLVGKLSQLFAVLTVLISCLGLFGLAAYTAERRTKEIGIRKVLGASVSNVVTLLSRDFLLLVAISSFVAFPLAWWFMHNWLQDFPYRIAIEWWVFAIAGVLAVVIALLTVSFQALKAGLMNPVKSLRTE